MRVLHTHYRIDLPAAMPQKRSRMTQGFHQHKIFHYLIGVLVLVEFAMPFAIRAQSVQTDQADLARASQPPFETTGTQPGIENGHAAESPNDADLGEQQILKRATDYKPLTLTIGCPTFYTSNVALTRSGE